MIQVKCIQKFRDKNNHIYGYRLQDINGQTQDVQPKNLKQAIASGKIHIVNLTLTTDGRLVNTTEKQLQNKKVLGKAPIIKENDLSKMEVFMLQVARKIFKSLGFSEEAQEISGLDNSYDGMIDKRYEIPRQYVYFDGEVCMLAITYYGKGSDVDKPAFWLAIENTGASSLCEMCAKSMNKAEIENTIANFIKEIKPHINN